MHVQGKHDPHRDCSLPYQPQEGGNVSLSGPISSPTLCLLADAHYPIFADARRNERQPAESGHLPLTLVKGSKGGASRLDRRGDVPKIGRPRERARSVLRRDRFSAAKNFLHIAVRANQDTRSNVFFQRLQSAEFFCRRDFPASMLDADRRPQLEFQKMRERKRTARGSDDGQRLRSLRLGDVTFQEDRRVEISFQRT